MFRIVMTFFLIGMACVGLLLMSLVFLAFQSRSGEAPGVQESGKLTGCVHDMRCVSSEYPAATASYVEPLDFSESTQEQAFERIEAWLADQQHVLKTQDENYRAYEVSTRGFGFVDDLEFRWDAEKQLMQVRSSSRVGMYDFGTNEGRVESLRRFLKAS
jgi:uncharacterized protein (DUF1499 family)